MLSMCNRSWRVCSVHASVHDVHAHCTHQFHMHMLSIFEGTFLNLEFLRFYWAYASETDAYAQSMHQFLTHMLSKHISSWTICSGYTSVPDAYSQHVLKVLCLVHSLAPDAYAQHMLQLLTHMLSTHTTSWRLCLAYRSVPDMHAQCSYQFLTRMLSVYKMNIWKKGKLMRMVRVCISWRARSVHTSVPGLYA